jgi:hypothetical protein
MQRFFTLAAVAAGVATAIRLGALLFPALNVYLYSATYPAWRHAAWCVIDPALGWLFLTRPPWSAWVYGIYGNLDDIAVDNPTRERWFNADAGFQPSAVERPEPEPDQHAVRPGHHRRVEPDALLHLRHAYRLLADAGSRAEQDSSIGQRTLSRVRWRFLPVFWTLPTALLTGTAASEFDRRESRRRRGWRLAGDGAVTGSAESVWAEELTSSAIPDSVFRRPRLAAGSPSRRP